MYSCLDRISLSPAARAGADPNRQTTSPYAPYDRRHAESGEQMTTQTETAFSELLDEVRRDPCAHGRAARRRRDHAARSAQMGALHPPGGGGGQRLGRQGPTALRRDRRAVQEVGRRQCRRLLLLRAHRPDPDLPGAARSRRRRLHVTHRLRRSRRRSLLDADRRVRQQPRGAAWTPTEPFAWSSRRRIHPSLAWPGSAWSPTPWRPSPATTWTTRCPVGGPPGTSRRTTRPRPTARTMPTWPGASVPPPPGYASRRASCPSRSARPTPSTRPTRCRPRPSAGPPATPPTPWAPSSWTTTRPSSSGGARPSASSGTCACGTGCCTPTTTTTSA